MSNAWDEISNEAFLFGLEFVVSRMILPREVRHEDVDGSIRRLRIEQAPRMFPQGYVVRDSVYVRLQMPP